MTILLISNNFKGGRGKIIFKSHFVENNIELLGINFTNHTYIAIIIITDSEIEFLHLLSIK